MGGALASNMALLVESAMNLLTIGPHADAWKLVAESLVFVPTEAIDAALSPLTSVATLDIIKFMVTLFLAIPLGLVARFVPLGAARHLYNFGIGIFYAQMCYGPGWLHLFFSSWVAYLILLLLPRTKSHLLVFGWMMAYMGVMHVYRMWSDWLGWQMDFSGPQMMATIKITSMAFNYHDGRASEGFTDEKGRVAKVEQTKADIAAVAEKMKTCTDPQQLKQYKKERLGLMGFNTRTKLAIVTLPGPLEFTGWMHNFSTYQAGPAIEIQEYLKVNNQSTKTEGAFLAAAQQFIVGILMLAAHFGIRASFSNGDGALGVVKDNGFLSPSILDDSLLARLAYVWLAGMGNQTKYFMAWKFGEAAASAFGYGSNGGAWNGCQNIDLKNWLFGQNMSICSKAWNQKTQAWLQTYIYFRVPFGRFGQIMSTYAVSAYWHGFYPGYYLTFVALGLLSTVQDNFRKHIRPYFMAADGSDDKVNTSLPKKLYDVLCLPGLHWAKTFAAFPFCVSTVANAWAGETRMGYLGLATLVFGLFVVPMIPVKRAKKKEA